MSDHATPLSPVDSSGSPVRTLLYTGDMSSAVEPVADFGDYELLGEIARGGMGIVYRARQKSLNRVVALKTISRAVFATPADVARFRAEAEVAAGLDHPNILPVYDIGEWQGQLYFSMKYASGGSLANLLKVTGPLTSRHTAGLVATLAATVHYAHQQSVLHRDLKPSNVLMVNVPRTRTVALSAAGDAEPMIVDFGIAKRLGGSDMITHTGAALGTPAYMPPEQARNAKGVTTAADVYSLGAILYECLTGHPPFRGDDPFQTMYLVIHEKPTDPTTLNPAADPDLCRIASKCLEKNPVDRYSGADQLTTELERWLEAAPAFPRPRPAERPDTQPENDQQVTPGLPRPLPAVVRQTSLPARMGNALEAVLPGGHTMAFTWCPPGSFHMGGDQYEDEQPIQTVRISSGFYMGVYTVTQADWKAVTGSYLSPFDGAKRPVVGVGWQAADGFCTSLSRLISKPVRLPTEAEWEYACRAGTITEYHWGDVPDTEKMNYDGTIVWKRSKKGDYRQVATDVGSFAPNPWGLFDMHGNVWEWCADFWSSGYDQNRETIDPFNSGQSKIHVLRGGSWFDGPRFCRSAAREKPWPEGTAQIYGFRVCFSAD